MGKTKGNEGFKDWPIRKKLTSVFAAIIVSTFLLIVVLLVGMKFIESRLNNLYTGPLMNVHYSAQMYYPQLDIQRALNRVLAGGTGKYNELYPQLEETVNQSIALMNEASDQLYTSILQQENIDRLDKINDKLDNEVTPYREQVFTYLKQGNYDAASEYNEAYYKPAVDETKAMIEEMEESIMAVASDYKESSSMLANTLVIVGIILVILVTIVAVVLAQKVILAITVPVAQIEDAAKQMRMGDLSKGDLITYEAGDELGVLAKTMRETINTIDSYVEEIADEFEQVAKGDLTKKFDDITDFLGDFASIKQSFVLILKEFNTTLAQIREAASQVDAGSDEIAGAANDLATGTGEQASAVEELTATINTVSSMAENAAKDAEKSYNSMITSVKEAQAQRLQMQELQNEMHHIKEISNEIEAIVTTIEEIASQTSLLSLNASIEAARAGEAGRGFAVVADQIGKLATDSAQAVVNTKELIGKTIEEIDKGNKVTEETAAGFERIIKEIEAFAESAKSTTETSNAQSQALQQVEAGIDQISLVTQQNAAASQECSAISEELAARATELASLVEKFKLHHK